MGQKVNPIGFRLKIHNNWNSNFYAGKDYKQKLYRDFFIRDYINKTFEHAEVSKVVIEQKTIDLISITIYSAKPGAIIGKKGLDIERAKRKIVDEMKCSVELNVEEIKRSDLDAVLIASNIKRQLEKRVSFKSFKKGVKKTMQSCLKMGGKGIKVSCSGRLGGAEIARTEWYKEGRLPLHTLRANINYAFREAKTTYGIIGIKVWVYIGD